MPITDAGARGVRGEVRREEPVDVQRERRRDRPVHGQERRSGQAHRLQAPASRSSSSATRTGTRQLDYRPAYLDEIKLTHERDRRQRRRPPGAAGPEPRSLDTNPPAQVLKRVAQRQKDQFVRSPGGGFRWFPLNTTIKPLDDVNVRKAILAGVRPRGGRQGARRHVRRRRSRRTSSRRASRASRRPAATKGAGLRLHGQPAGRHGARRQVHEEGRLRVRQVRRRRRAPDGHRQRRPGQGPGRGRQGAAREARLQDPLRTVPQDAVYTECCQVPAKKVAVCGRRRLVQGLQRPAVDARADVQRRTNITPERQQQPARSSTIPTIDKAMDEAAAARGRRAQRGLGRDRQDDHRRRRRPCRSSGTTRTIASKNVQGVVNAYINAFDFTFTSLK